ncbi:MAG: efflux RND transporter periplasmic adaptor subunit [Acidobacteriaceae bacterium]
MGEIVDMVWMVSKVMTRLLTGFSVCLIASAVAGCSSSKPSSDIPTVAAASAAPQPVAETVKQPAPSATADDLVVTGPVTMEQQLDVVALRSGVITSLNADVDAEVRSGQILAQLDDRELADDRSAAAYKAKSLEADLKNWQAEVEVRNADLRRAQELRKDGINTQEALDHAQYDLAATKFEVERQRGEMQSAQATLKSLDMEMEKTQIVAPFTGEVSQRYVRLGQYVHVGDRIFQVTGNSPLEIRFTVPALEGTSLRRGSLVTVSATPDFRVTAPAAVTHLSPVVDPGSGTMEVTAVLSRKMPGLLPGMVASVRVPHKP